MLSPAVKRRYLCPSGQDAIDKPAENTINLRLRLPCLFIVLVLCLLTLSIRGNAQTVYAFFTKSFRATRQIATVNTSTNATTSAVDFVTPYGIAITPNGKFAYITNTTANSVDVLNLTNYIVTASIPVGNLPHHIVINPAGTRAYVGNVNDNTVSVIDTAANAVVATLPVGTQPAQIAITPDGSQVYVACSGSNAVSVIKTAANTVTSIGVGNSPVGVAASASTVMSPTRPLGPSQLSIPPPTRSSPLSHWQQAQLQHLLRSVQTAPISISTTEIMFQSSEPSPIR